MLTEYNYPGEQEGDFTRRWFSDSYFDLFVWLDKQGTIDKFQLCYNKSLDEHALTWKHPSSYYHQKVDDGENRPGKSKSTPILVPDGMFEVSFITERFLHESLEINSEIKNFIHQKLLEFKSHAVA
jgi:hypothetical protein